VLLVNVCHTAYNYAGPSPFSLSPSKGTVESGGTRDLVVSFVPPKDAVPGKRFEGTMKISFKSEQTGVIIAHLRAFVLA
jgi:hypothetical protein